MRLFVSALVGLLLSPGTVQACAVCFGDSNPELSRGFFWGILVLLVLPFGLAGLITGLIVYNSRKNSPVPDGR